MHGVDARKSQMTVPHGLEVGIRAANLARQRVGPSHKSQIIVEEQLSARWSVAHQQEGCTLLGRLQERFNARVAQNVNVVNEERVLHVAQERQGMFDGSAGLEQLGPLVGEPDVHPGIVPGTPFLNHIGMVMHIYHSPVYVCFKKLLQNMLQQRLASHWHKSLRHGISERTQARTHTGSKYHSTTRCHGKERLMYVLLTMDDVNLDTKLSMQIFAEMLGTIDTTMLATCATEREHEVGESTLQIAFDVHISQPIDVLQEGKYLAIVLQESDNGLVKSGQLLVGLVSTGIVRAATIKDISATITAIVLRDAFTEGETIYMHHQRPLAIVLTESGRSVLWMSGIGIVMRNPIAVGTGHRLHGLMGKLRQINHG
jgi:hypothetical protein